MEILIAILWYLQMIFVGNTYTTQQIDMMYMTNQQVINDIQANTELTNTIWIDFNNAAKFKIENDAIDVWEEDPAEPIPN